MNKKFDKIVIGIAIIVFAITPAVYSLDIRVLWAVILDLGEISIVAMASVFTGFVSVLIAGFSLWLSKQADKRNEKQARLLVQPRLTSETFDRNVPMTSNMRHIGFEIKNNGIGPALIKNAILFFDGKEVLRNDGLAYINFISAKTQDFKEVKFEFVVPDSIIGIGKKQVMWQLQYDTITQTIDDIIKLDLQIEYESIYQDRTFIFDSRDDFKTHDEKSN